MSDIKQIEFLAEKSKEMVEKQIDSYRQKHSNAGIIIGVVALFIPFFLNGLDNAYPIVQYLSILPIGFFVWATIQMLEVLRTKKLYQFFSVDKFKDLVNAKYEDILLYEIGANNDSYRDNKPVDEKVNRKFNLGIKLTTISIIISVGLLLANNFYQPKKEPTQVQIVNIDEMPDKEKTEKPKVIPTVPPKDREKLNEGVEKPQRKPTTDGN
ncbi:MAG: hypothetical protein V2B15_03640 [Bacteroidota bacterium]